MMKELCLVEAGNFSSLWPLTHVQFLDHNSRFVWTFDVKLLESRLKEVSNDIKITKIELKMRKL